MHILEPYIHTYENMTWGFMPLARDFPPGLPGLACGGGAPQPCALSWKCICTIFILKELKVYLHNLEETEDERMLSTHSGICLFSVERRNQHKSNKRDFPSSSSTNPRLLYIIIAHFSKPAWGHHPWRWNRLLLDDPGVERNPGERQSSGRRLNMMQKLTRGCKNGIAL